MNMAATIIHDSSEAVELCCSRRLFLKPVSKLVITVLWVDRREVSKAASNWEVMARLKQMALPLQFTSIRVSKSTLDFVRFEAELETKASRNTLCQKLDGCILDSQTGSSVLQVLALESNADFPSRQEWDSFFLDKEGWPDTLHLDGLPCKWFNTPESSSQKPREEIVREVFEKFGPIRNMDIPALDVYREEMGSRSASTYSITGLHTFDVYLQFQEHEHLRNAMESLRGMRLMLKEGDGKALVCNIKVSLDLTSHLSEAAVQKRQLERRQLEALEEQRQREKIFEREEEADRKRREDQRSKKRLEKLKRRAERQREEFKTRTVDSEAESQAQEEEELWEERKFLLVQRRLQSIRLLSALLHRAQGLAKVKCEKKANRNEKLCFTNQSPLSEKINDSKMAFRRNSPADIKKTIVCPPDTTVPDFFTEHLSCDETIPFQECPKQSSDYGPLQITISQDHSDRDLALCVRPPVCHSLQSYSTLSGGDPSTGKLCSPMHKKKEKIYESEEFLNYILNHYTYPSYGRLCQNPQTSLHRESGWQRMVSDNGKGFQISLRNSDGGVCTEVSISQNSDQSNTRDEDRYRWKITIKETEPAQKRLGVRSNLLSGYSREFEVCWNKSTTNNQHKSLEDHPRSGTFFIKDFDRTHQREFTQDSQSSVPPVNQRKYLSHSSKHLENIPRNSDVYMKIEDWKHVDGSSGCEKTTSRDCVCVVGYEKEGPREGFLSGTSKTACSPAAPQLVHKERKKTKKLKEPGIVDKVDPAKVGKKRKKKKKEKHRVLEAIKVEKVVKLEEPGKWTQDMPVIKPDQNLTHRNLSHELLDASSERQGRKEKHITYHDNWKSIVNRYDCDKEFAHFNYTSKDNNFGLCGLASNSKEHSLVPTPCWESLNVASVRKTKKVKTEV